MKKSSPQFLRTFLPLSLVLLILGLGGLLLVIQGTLPTIGPRWLFFFLGVIGFLWFSTSTNVFQATHLWRGW